MKKIENNVGQPVALGAVEIESLASDYVNSLFADAQTAVATETVKGENQKTA